MKNVLYQNCTNISPAPANNTDPDWCNWAPFSKFYDSLILNFSKLIIFVDDYFIDAENHSALFGSLDSAFLFSYAIAMFFR